jgi:hypothetical protein
MRLGFSAVAFLASPIRYLRVAQLLDAALHPLNRCYYYVWQMQH